MTNREDSSSKRLRYSSSESDTPKPPAKKMAASQMFTLATNVEVEGQANEDLIHQAGFMMQQQLDPMSQILLSLQNLQQGQISLRQSIDDSIKQLKTELETAIDTKLETFKNSIKTDLDTMSTDITSLTERVAVLETRDEQTVNQQHPEGGNQADKVIIIKGLPEIEEETLYMVFLNNSVPDQKASTTRTA